MRIAVIHSFYGSGAPSGENQVVLDQHDALQSDGHDVRLFRRDTDVLSRQSAYSARAAATTLTGRGEGPDLTGGGWEPDVVHLHNTFPNWGTHWIDRWRDRLVVTLHNFRTVCAAATLFRDGGECHDCLTTSTVAAVRHACYRDSRLQTIPLAIATRDGGSLNRIPRVAARVIALNEHAQTVFTNQFSRPIDLIPNFVPSSQAEPDGQRAWAYVGRLDAAKGVTNLLRHWPADHLIHIFGSGPDSGTVAKIAERSRGTVMLHGMTQRDDLLRRLPTFTGLVVPSLWKEGLPTVVLEALAAGLPLVVASPVAAAAHLERSGASITYDPWNPESLRSALTQSTRHRRQMSLAALALHLREYSAPAWLRRINQLYAAVAETGH